MSSADLKYQATLEQFKHKAVVAQVRARVDTYTQLMWKGQKSYRDADITRLVEQIVPRIQAGQLQIANLTNAYLSKVTGTVAKPVNRAVVTGGRGVPADVVYSRPAKTLYIALSEGKTFLDAVELGAERLSAIVATDMQMANVRQARESLRGTGVTRYERIPSGTACSLCEIASTQQYWVKDLMPIHTHCGCSVEPITVDRPWDQAAMDDRLANAYERQAVEVAVRDHGELGPVLTNASDHFKQL